MEFKDKYTDDPKDITKKFITPEAYAIGEMLEELKNKLEHLRQAGLFRK